MQSLFVVILAHRALDDVEAMEKLFTETKLVNFLSSLPIHTAKKQLGLWNAQREAHTNTTQLINFLEKPDITPQQAKRLNDLGLNHEVLVELRSDCTTPEEFKEELHRRGVNSKLLLEKLSMSVR